MNQRGNKWDQNQTFYNVMILALQQVFLSEGTLVNFGMTSHPSLATLLSNALTCPQPTIHPSSHHNVGPWQLRCILFFSGGECDLYDKAQSGESKQLKMSHWERKTLDGRFALICKDVSVYAPMCPLWGPVCPPCCFWMSESLVKARNRFRAREAGHGTMSMWCSIRLRVVGDCLEALCVTSPSS